MGTAWNVFQDFGAGGLDTVVTDLTEIPNRSHSDLQDLVAPADDHTQYALADKSRPNPWVSAADLSGLSIADLGTKDHDLLDGLGDDDHSQYLLLAGRAGGQNAIGGLAAGEELGLRGSADANLGLLRAQSPIVFNDVTPAVALSPYSIDDSSVQTINQAYVGGTYSDRKTITFTNSLFVYETLRGSPIITSGVTPSFAAFTLFNALPVLRAGAGAGQNPLQALTLNVGAVIENPVVGTRTAANNTAVNAAMQTKASISGAVMTMTNVTGLQFSPTFSTVAGSTANLGTLRGLWCRNPSVALFQPQAGIETMAGYYGVVVDAIPFGGNVNKAALVSGIAAATNARFLWNTGGANSDMGNSHMHFNDNFGIMLGGAFGASDTLIRWLAASSAISFFFSSTFDDLQLIAPAADTFTMTSNLFPGNEFRFGFSKFAFGQTSSVGNQVGVFVAPARATTVAGEWSDFLLTQAGNLTIDHNIGGCYAWVINAISLTSGAGTLTGPVATLNIGGMTTSGLGGALTHAVRVTGRTTLRGPLSLEPTTPAALAADVNNWQGQGLGNNARPVIRAEASGANRTITGVDRLQINDTVYIINVGASNDIILAHENASSAAENRMISPTGADLFLGPGEYAFMWHDDVTDRWRILDTNGA